MVKDAGGMPSEFPDRAFGACNVRRPARVPCRGVVGEDPHSVLFSFGLILRHYRLVILYGPVESGVVVGMKQDLHPTLSVFMVQIWIG